MSHLAEKSIHAPLHWELKTAYLEYRYMVVVTETDLPASSIGSISERGMD